MQEIVNNIFSVDSIGFDALVLQLFRWQYNNNIIYKQWTDSLKIDPAGVGSINEIPFLPVSFFKDYNIMSGSGDAKGVFTSSGTTGMVSSRHYVKDLSLYKQSFMQAFNLFYGDVKQWCVVGLLPSYLERTGSSLVVMVDELIRRSGHPLSGFYLYDFNKLADVLQQLEAEQQPTLLIGVTFALLDFAEQHNLNLRYTKVMETGGMKGRKREMVRQEVHSLLKERLGLNNIHSEYGMTELLSQAYSKGGGVFECPPWMRVLVREEDDPLKISSAGRGVINIIDLANIYSCCFIATDDVGTVYSDGRFEVAGRMDASDIRGCSLLAL